MKDYSKEIRLPPKKLFINGEFVDAQSGKTFAVINPATEAPICFVAEGSKADVDCAVEAATRALIAWRNVGHTGRQKLLFRLAELWEQNAEELGRLESFNNGGPIGVQTAVIKGLADDIRYYASWCGKVDGRVASVDGNFHVFTRKEPLGVCGIIVPWNLPLWCMMVKLAPCLAMGNTAIVKPSEQTPLSALRAAELFVEAGFPPGVVNIIPGFGPTAGAALCSHLKIAKVAFTGSTEVGRIVMETAAKSNLKHVQLELGGKSPVVVFPDADLDEAVAISSVAIFTNNGELCTAGSRTFVHKDIYDSFVQKAVERARQLKVGDQLDSANQVGPLVDSPQYKKVLNYIEWGKKEGATLAFGGRDLRSQFGNAGYFVEPTVFTNVRNDMKVAHDEIFGPVQCIIPWNTIDEVVTMCNETEYGLAAAIVSKDISNVFSISSHLKAGIIWVNTYHVVLPCAEFGGFKQSGFGKEGGPEGVADWTVTKSVVVEFKPKL